MAVTCFSCRESPPGYPENPYSAYCPGCAPRPPRPLARGAHGCGRCGIVFGTMASFGAHQDTDYDRLPAVTCQEPAAMGLVADHNGTWQTPEGLASREQKRQMLAGLARGRAQGRVQASPGVIG
jgi:hypothetical protein